MRQRRAGFTLMELLIVVAIIAVLVAVGIPIFASQLDRAREAACAANRRSLKAVVVASYLSGAYDSCQQAFDHCYTAAEYPCPSGGVYTWKASGESGSVVCSVHSGQSGGGSETGGTGKTYGQTGLAVTDSCWPTDADYQNNWDTVTVKAGGIFQYTDGSYYIVVKDTALTKGQAASGPGGTAYNWFSTVKLTGTVVSYSGDEQKSDLKRGDLCLIGGSYYVYIDGGSWASSPLVSPNQWYKLP